MSDISIRPATPDDAELIFRFVRELAVYEKAEHEVMTTAEEIRRTVFADDGTVSAIICHIDDTPVGFAVYFYSYSTWLGRRGIYLEDLYVSPEYRGAGAGKALLQHLAHEAVANGCGRLEWSVLDWNEPAIQFYRSIGGEAQDEWIRYRLSGEALQRFCASD